MDHSLDIVRVSGIHGYDTRNKDILTLPKVHRNWENNTQLQGY